jgi:L,D-transpeptidase-like protein
MRSVGWALLVAALGCKGAGADEALAKGDAEAAPTASVEASATADEESEAGEAPLAVPGTPIVDLGGVAQPMPPPGDGAQRLGAVRWLTYVRKAPSKTAKVLGWLRAGATVTARAEAAAKGDGCAAGWRAIEPHGWVCMDDMTEELEHEVIRALVRRPDFTQRLPYMYGTVTRGGPVYARLPSAEQLKQYEPGLAKHIRKWKDDEESGARYGLDVWLRYTAGSAPDPLEALEQRVTGDDIPFFLEGGRAVPSVSAVMTSADAVKIDQVDRRQGRSFVYSMLWEGRRYNVTPDLTVIPADRFRPIRGSSFHGWRADQELKLPFALVRRPGAKKWLWSDDKDTMVDGGDLEWRSAVMLTGKQRFWKNVLHFQTAEGFWVDDRHASRVDPAKRWPKWAQQGAKWIDINLTRQVLVAYEGQTMVYATLISSGEAGLDDPENSTATIRGIYRIHTKWISNTMDNEDVGEEFELRDVPYVQYFKDGYALHGAYWHDGFGKPKSHGCINLAPEDARRLFFWTEPQVPEGWHGAKKSLTGTIVFVHP